MGHIDGLELACGLAIGLSLAIWAADCAAKDVIDHINEKNNSSNQQPVEYQLEPTQIPITSISKITQHELSQFSSR